MKGERQCCFVENNVTGDDDAVCGEVEAPVALVVRRIANKGKQGRAGSELVWSGGGEVGVAGAPESLKLTVGGKSAMESEERSAHVQGLGWKMIDEEGGGGKTISLVGGEHGCLEQQCASDIVDGAKHALNFAIFLRGVGA
jgi:hypothetical protein